MKVLAIVNKNFSKEYADITVKPITIDGHLVHFSLLDIEDPIFDEKAKENEQMVFVRKKAFSLNYRDKGFIFSAAKFFETHPAALSYFPFGSDFCGVVEKVGPGVETLQVGDHVICNDAYPFSGHKGVLPGIATNNASKELEVFHYSKLIKLPAGISIEQAAAAAVGAQTGYSMIRRTNVGPNDHVLITAGSANTSLFLLAALRHRCKNIYVLSTSLQHKDKLLGLGATHFIHYNTALDFQDPKQPMNAFVEKGVVFNVVFDPFNDLYLDKVVDHIDYFGQYITCGVFNQSDSHTKLPIVNESATVTDLLHFAIFKNVSFIGNCLGSTEDLVNAITDMEKGTMQVVIDTVFEEDDFEAFIQRSYVDRNRFGKVVMRYTDEA
jgi:NADPH:quinone reductase-like Zn-dependent oxidoreductase